MKIHWHGLSFVHSCGLAGTIIEVCISRDGGILMSGCCVVCGEEFKVEDTIMNIVSKCAVADFMSNRSAQVDDLLGNFTPQGKPS